MQAKWIAVYVFAMILGTLYLGCKAYTSVSKLDKIERAPQSELHTQGDPMLTEYVLAAHLAMYPVTENPNFTQQDAWRYAGKAAYIELGVGSFVEQLEKRIISEDLKPYLGYSSILLRLVGEKQITYTWRF